MRVTFRRFPGGVDSYSEIERDDGAVFRMAEFTRGGARLPHDLRHLVVELELGVTDGIWGTIADGGMYASMRFAGGHRLPHDAARKSDALTKARHHRLGRAELFANLAESIAALGAPTDAQVREIIRRHLAVVPLSEPGQDPARVVELPPPAALVVAAVALRAAAEKWAALPVGTELSYEWTPRQSSARTRAAAQRARVTAPARPRREGGKGSGKAGGRHGQRRRGSDGCKKWRVGSVLPGWCRSCEHRARHRHDLPDAGWAGAGARRQAEYPPAGGGPCIFIVGGLVAGSGRF